MTETTDPTRADLGVALGGTRRSLPTDADARHPFVTLGDSLTQGFASGAIAHTENSWPKLVADALGLSDEQFRLPRYDGPAQCPGLPLNIEHLLKSVEARMPDAATIFSRPVKSLRLLHALMDEVEDYWERGAGAVEPPPDAPPVHNVAVYGWDVRDALDRSYAWCRARVRADPVKDNPFGQVVQANGERAALRVLTGPGSATSRTPIGCVTALGSDGGIGTLVVALGANNALASVLSLNVRLSGPDYADMAKKSKYTVWRPSHFAAEYAALAQALRGVRAARVILATVPHVTIAPIARGVGVKPKGSAYFARYTRPWISDAEFDPNDDLSLTGDQCRTVDGYIDDYNAAIRAEVAAARAAGHDWYLLDLCRLLDSLAYRRYLVDESARPPGFEPYILPDALLRLIPVPDTRFFRSDQKGRTEGGLFSLDGTHATLVGYGIMAKEVLAVMQAAGVPGADPTSIDFADLVARDTLLRKPPTTLSKDLKVMNWLDESVDWVLGMVGRSGAKI